MSKDTLQTRKHGNETGGVIAKMLLVLFLGIAATVGSFFVFPGFWRERLADYLLGNKTVEPPTLSDEAAKSAGVKIDDLKNRIKGLDVVDKIARVKNAGSENGNRALEKVTITATKVLP